MKQLLVYVQCVGSNGVLAQLGARNIRNVEATGSNPVYSILQGIVQFSYCGYVFLVFSMLKNQMRAVFK